MSFPVFKLQTINQEEIESKLQFSPIQKTREQGVALHEVTKNVLQSSFVCSVIGSPGAGKSTLIQTMLLDDRFYGGKFQRVIFIGPSKYKGVVQDSFNTKKVLDIGWIYRQIEECNLWKCKSMLIIFDDVIASVRNCHSIPQFVDLFYNRRHLLDNGVVSVILTSQKYNMIPTFIRSCTNMQIIFPVGRLQLETVIKQLNLDIPRKTLLTLFARLKPHEFYYINSQTNRLFNSSWSQV